MVGPDASVGDNSNVIRTIIHTLPMSSLPRNEIIKDDVEAQHQRSDWLSKVRHILRADREEVEDKFGFWILKVPESNRQPPEEFNPAGWRLGLHNRENLDTTGLEALKLSFAVAFGLVGEEWIKFCNFVVHDAKSMLVCYGLHEEVPTLSEEVIKQVLALDALFLAVVIDMNFPTNESELWSSKLVTVTNMQMFESRLCRWYDFGFEDLCKIENQIPFILIKRVIKYIRNHANSSYEDADHLLSDANDGQDQDGYLKKWMQSAVEDGIKNFMEISGGFYEIENPYPSLQDSDHILDFAFKAICGEKGMLRTSDYSQESYIHIPSATTLRNSGIRICGVVGPLCTMSYENKCLSLPRMKMVDVTVSLVRNIARHVEYNYGKRCMFHDYVHLICDLIETPEDFKTLVECGVIDNGCGSRGFEKWKDLDEGLMILSSSKVHNDLKSLIKRRCDLRRYRFWSEFRTVFCSRPWYVLSAITIVVVTVATLIQTYAAVIGSNRLKPQFGQ